MPGYWILLIPDFSHGDTLFKRFIRDSGLSSTLSQNLVAARFEQAAATLGKGTVAQLARERAAQTGASPTITIRLAESDQSHKSQNVRHQPYLNMLLHQALSSEEKFARRR